MLSKVSRSKRAVHSHLGPVLIVVQRRALATESSHSTSPDFPPHALPPSTPPASSNAKKYRLHPQPRPAVSHRHAPLPKLPPTFGRNQLLPVSNSTRALLESVVSNFNAPIRYAFAYGSGVFEQDGYAQKEGSEKPMLDFMFAVTHPAHFHSINMQQFPSHYPLYSRVFGSSYISKMQEISPGVWFNPYVELNGVTIKYGVTTVDNLCADLLNWRTLYLAGRMHKPLRIIKDDARVRLTQQVNLTSAVRAALLTLPESFSERQLFERIAGISYTGDPRMVLPAENRGKVTNIVAKQESQFRELYHRLVVGLPGVHWAPHSTQLEQDTSAKARSAHLKKLPVELLGRMKANYARKGVEMELLESDEAAYWSRLAGAEDLASTMRTELGGIVRYPATVQTLKGIASAGVGKSMRYGTAKVKKWWGGS